MSLFKGHCGYNQGCKQVELLVSYLSLIYRILEFKSELIESSSS